MTASMSDPEPPSPAQKVSRISTTSLSLAFESERSLWDHVGEQIHKWHFVATALPPSTDDDFDDTSVHVGRGRILVVDLYNERDPVDALDEDSGDAVTVGAAIFDSGDLNEDFADLIEPLGDRVLILDSIEIVPDLRGQGLGPLIAGLAITALSGGAVAAVCYPAPFERPSGPDGQPRDFRPGEREAAVAKLSKLWATLGFEHFRDGVHYVSMSHTTFSESFQKILEDHGLS